MGKRWVCLVASRSMTRLPGPRAPWDQLRWAWRLDHDPPAAILGLARQYGPVCAVGVRPFRYVFLFGPEAHRELFTDIERFTWRGAMKALKHKPVKREVGTKMGTIEKRTIRRALAKPS